VAISYAGREMRWLNAAKGAFIKRMPGDQKIRSATRIAARSLKLNPEND
jgi:acetolactate synthase-1/2/3 large subunit